MKIAGIALLLLLLGGAAYYLTACPCGPVPGARLFGDELEEPVTDWTFVNDREAVPLCQLQITPWRPHSINLNCMSANESLYISCSNCDGKRWSRDAISHPDAMIRAGFSLYPVTLQRVTDAGTLDEVWEARRNKVGAEARPRPDHWWSFHLVSRSS